MSPDGSQILYTVSVPDIKTDKGLTFLWAVPSSGGSPKRFTHSGKDRSPRWSRDGKRIAFISDRSGKAQIWVLDTTGGEAWHLPTEQAVQNIAWAPDGKSLAFSSRDFTKAEDWEPYPGAPEKDRERAASQAKQTLEGSNPASNPTSEDGPKVSDVKVITRFKYRADGKGYMGDLRNHVFTVAIPDEAREPEAAPKVSRITGGDFDHDSLAWSPDGKFLAVTALRREDADYLEKQDIWLVDTESSAMTRLYSGDGPVHNPSFSPNGSRLAFAGHDGSHGASTHQGLWVLDLGEFWEALKEQAGGKALAPLTQKDAECLTKTLDRPLGYGSSSDIRYGAAPPYKWESDETLLFLVSDRGAGSLYRAHAGQGNSETLPSKVWGQEMRNLVAFDYGAGKFVFLVGSPDETEDLYSFCEGAAPTRLTDTNPWLKDVNLGETRRITFRGAQNWDIDAFLTLPVNYREGQRYPLVLSVHGGPAGAYGPNFIYQWQLLAAKGFAVLGANPRGSTSYSQEFTSAVVDDWGGQDYLDLMAGVDKIVADGIADPSNLFVTGWSYGGFMTSWIVTQTNRFKAAVGGAIIANRYSMYSTEDIVLVGEHHFGGNPWDDGDKLLSRSAIAYVKNVTTPFMVLHGELDIRCPTSQGEEFFAALKRLGKEAVFVRYPGEYHGLTRFTHRIDRFERTVAWFEYYARNGQTQIG